MLLFGCASAPQELKSRLSDADAGPIWFASAGSLRRDSDDARLVVGAPVTLSGELAFPSGTGPFPAVVLAHGCSGRGFADAAWASVLREWGYATFALDSFTGRGLTEVCTRARALTGTQRIPDAYGALRILATHPRIDSRRIALMGFSHGGILTLGAATAWAKETFAPPGLAFRAFLPVYPFCNTSYPERDRLAAPLRIHVGQLDDWTPAEACIRLVERLRASGQDAVITQYANAHHGFDVPGQQLRYLQAVDNPAKCEIRMPSILGPPPPPAELARCFTKGATVAGNTTATQEARRSVRAQLEGLLK